MTSLGQNASGSSWFDVDPVQPATHPLVEIPSEQAVESKVGYELQAVSANLKGKNLVYRGNNAFVQTVHEAFASHRPLSIGPEDILMLLAQGVSQHVNTNFIQLKDKIFVDAKPTELVVRNDELAQTPEAWASLLHSYTQEVKPNLKLDLSPFFESDLSTTTSEIRTALEIVGLETYKKVYTYVAETGCGIPKIELRGSVEDWEKVQSRLSALHKVDMEWWAKALTPVLSEFINAKKGNINLEFWQSIYKNDVDYGEEIISGWIVLFFPYIIELDYTALDHYTYEEDSLGEYSIPAIENSFIRNPVLEGNKYLLAGINTEKIPSGLSKVDVVWNNYNSQTSMKIQLCAGFMGISQNANLALSPVIGWCAANTLKETKLDLDWYDERDANTLVHRFPERTVFFMSEPTQTAYFSKKGQSGNNNQELAVELGLRLEMENAIPSSKIHEYEVLVGVYADNTLGPIYLVHQNITEDAGDVKQFMQVFQSIKGHWTAGKCSHEDFVRSNFTLQEMTPEPEKLIGYDSQKLVAVNSWVKLKL